MRRCCGMLKQTASLFFAILGQSLHAGEKIFVTISKIFGFLNPDPNDTNAQPPEGWFDTYKEALAKAGPENKMVLVKLHADWCGYCKQFDIDISSPGQMTSYIEENFVGARVKESTREGKQFKKTHKIIGFPCFLVFSSSGEFIAKVRGYQGPYSLRDALKSAIP